MNIGIYQYSSLSTGEETFIYDLASSLVKYGHEVHIITSNQLPLIGSKRNLTPREVLDRIGGTYLYEFRFLKTLPYPSSISKIRNILRSCDVLYVKNEIFELSQLQILKAGMSIPTICGIHTAVFYPHSSSFRSKMHNLLYVSEIYSHLLHQCNAIHVLNDFDLKLMKTHFRIKESRVFLIPLGVDTQVFRPKHGKSIVSSDEKFKVLFLGRLDEQKGLDILYRAILRLHGSSEFEKMTFTIGGSGKLENLARALAQIYPNVKYLGFIPQKMIVDLYNSHDVVIVPSRWETLSYVCLEAQSCGIPVIATNIPGPNIIVKHGETGLLIPPEDPDSLAHAILYMFRIKSESPYLYGKMKKLSRENVVKNFSLETEVKRLLGLFDLISISSNSEYK
jgi:glycosyltransferase involved in cell wall biosynthesis